MAPSIINFATTIGILSILQASTAQIYTRPQETIVASILSEPFLSKIQDSTLTGNDQFEGFVKDLADKLFERLGLLYRIKIVTKYGYKDNKTGDWEGLIGELVSKRSDMVLADLSVTSVRAEVVDFSVPFMETQLAILMKSIKKRGGAAGEGEADSGFFPWLQPMSAWFWVTFIIAALILIFLIFVTEKTVSRKIGTVQPPPPEGFFAEFASRVFGTPKSIATRVLQVTFWIFVLICFSAYTSNFAADKILDLVEQSGEKKPLPIKSVEELLDQDKIKYGLLKGGSTYNYFQTSEDLLISKLNEKITEGGSFVETYARGISRVQNSNASFAFIMESPAAKYAVLKKPCNLALVPQLFGPKNGFSVAISKDSRKFTLSKINSAILELNEAGVLDNLAEKWFKDQTECDDGGKGGMDIDREYNPSTIGSLASLFILLTISIFVVFIIAGVETGLNRKTEQT